MTLGTIALTTYNNRTYRIDDIDWEANLNTTFEKNGEKVRFADYYQSKYQIRIRDPRQPLLVSKMSQRQRRAGENEIVYLVPELCRATGRYLRFIIFLILNIFVLTIDKIIF